MAVKVGINGFGRIGRQALRAILERAPDLEVVAINDLVDTRTNAHLFKYDSTYGPFHGTVEAHDDALVVNGKRIQVLAQRDWTQLGWDKLGVEIVIESSGVGTNREQAEKHLQAGAKKVIISAPARGEDITIVLGVNQDKYDPSKHHIISNASCTTNGLAPLAKVINDRFGIEKGLMSTIHSVTNSQRLLDLAAKDLREARAAGQNIVPTSTGAARAVALVIPELKGKFDGIAFRVPTPTVSIVDFTVVTREAPSVDELNNAFREASAGPLKGIMDVTTEPLVSMDLKGNSNSTIVDLELTRAIGNMSKISSWYDNEWGYACRVADVTSLIAEMGV